MRFVSIPLGNLRRRPVRTALTTMGVAIAVGGYVAMMGLSSGVDRAWNGSYAERGTDLLAIRKGAVEIFSTSIDARVAAAIAKAPGVADAAGELADLLPLENGPTTILCGWAEESYLWRSVKLREGRLPAPSEPDGALIGQLTADSLGKRTGDTIQLLDRSFRVVGVSRAGNAILGGAVVLPLAALQSLLDRPGQVTVIQVRLARPLVPGTLAALKEQFPALTFTETETLAEHNEVLGALRAFAWMASTIGLAIAIVVVVNTLLMSVMERTREFGVLTAIGWAPARVVSLVVLEALAVSLAGGAIGVAAGSLAIRRMATATMLRSFVEPHVSLWLLLTSVAAAVLLGVVASAYPAWRAASISTARALRYE